MFRLLTGIFIFLIILTLYLHVSYHLKTSNEDAVYETTFQSKEQLDNICKLRQPIVFDYHIIPFCQKEYLIDKYGNTSILIKNVDTSDYIPYKLKDAIELIDKDTTGSYYIENNDDTIQQNMNMKEHILKYERDIRPAFTCKCIYDILIGSNNSSTPLKYEVNYRNYFMVNEGSVNIRLAPPNAEDYLNPVIDYETLEVTSPYNVWKTKTIDNVNFTDVVVSKGQMIYIPPYWWYSIQFTSNTTIMVFKYRTYMNIVTLMPQLFMQILQIQNIQYVVGNNIAKNEPSTSVKKKKNKKKKNLRKEKATTE
jgi:hypothetical protein